MRTPYGRAASGGYDSLISDGSYTPEETLEQVGTMHGTGPDSFILTGGSGDGSLIVNPAFADQINDDHLAQAQTECEGHLAEGNLTAEEALAEVGVRSVTGDPNTFMFSGEFGKRLMVNPKYADDPTPDEPTDEPANNNKSGFDFISKLFAWLTELFQMFTRWIQK